MKYFLFCDYGYDGAKLEEFDSKEDAEAFIATAGIGNYRLIYGEEEVVNLKKENL